MANEEPKAPSIEEMIQEFRKRFNLSEDDPVDWLKLFSIMYNRLSEHMKEEGGTAMPNDNIKLKPCPFCGSEARLVDLGEPGEFEDWDVECADCGIVMLTPGQEEGCVTTKEEAVNSWNRRSNDTADVEPKRNSGYWLDVYVNNPARMRTMCSECGMFSGIGGIPSNRHKPYCPNCGSPMLPEPPKEVNDAE